MLEKATSPGFSRRKLAVEQRHDDIVGLMDVPARLGAGLKPPLGDPHMRLRNVDVGRGFGAWGHRDLRPYGA